MSCGELPAGMITPSASSPASATVRGRMPPTSSGGTTTGGQSRATLSRCTYRPFVVTVCPCSSAYSAAVYSRSNVMGDSTLAPT